MSEHLDFIQRALDASPDNTMTVRALAIMLYMAESRKAVLSRNLAQALRLPKPTVSRLTRHLWKIGLLEKDRNGKDKRDCWLRPTEKGRAFVASVTAETALAA